MRRPIDVLNGVLEQLLGGTSMRVNSCVILLESSRAIVVRQRPVSKGVLIALCGVTFPLCLLISFHDDQITAAVFPYSCPHHNGNTSLSMDCEVDAGLEKPLVRLAEDERAFCVGLALDRALVTKDGLGRQLRCIIQ